MILIFIGAIETIKLKWTGNGFSALKWEFFFLHLLDVACSLGGPSYNASGFFTLLYLFKCCSGNKDLHFAVYGSWFEWTVGISIKSLLVP